MSKLDVLAQVAGCKSPRVRSARLQGSVVRLLGLLLLAPVAAFAADLQITDLSDFGFDPSPAGSTVVYNVTVENGAADTVTDGVVVFDLPAGTSAGTLPAFCAADLAVPTRIRCTMPTLVGTLAPTGAPFTFQLPVNTVGRPVGSMQVTGAIGFAAGTPAATTPLSTLGPADPFYAGDTNAANNRLTETTTLESAGDLRLTKTGTPDPVVGGAEVTYTLTVTNAGPSVSTNFNVVDSLPAAATYVAGSFTGAGFALTTNTPTTLTGTFPGTLAVGATASFTFRARINAATGTVINSATVNAFGTPDPDTGNNTAQAQTAVVPGADVTVAKSVFPTPAISGEAVEFRLVTRNLGPSAAANVTLADVMPTGFVITGTTAPAGWTCDSPTNARTCTRTAPMPAGAVETISIFATVPASGTNSSGNVTNSAVISSDTPDPNGPVLGTNNNIGSATFTVLANGADLALSKQKTPAIVTVYNGVGSDVDSRMTSTINVRNVGPQAATGQVQVVDLLGAGEEFVPGTPTTPWTCTANAYAPPPARQSVTCDLDPAGLPLAVGANAPPLVLITRAVAAGTLTNDACTGGSGGSLEPLTGGGINVDPVPGNDCTGVGTRTTTQRSDLGIAKQTNGAGAADNTVTAAQAGLSYTLTVTNSGPDATAGVVVNDIIPGWVNNRSGVTFVAPAGWNCSNNQGSVVCASGNTVLANGASAAIVLNVTRPLFDSASLGAGTCNGVATTDTYCNTAGVGVDAAVPGAVGETNMANNSASDTVRIDRVSNVATTAKTITSAPMGRAGVNTTYQMSFINRGPSTAPNVVFRDTLALPANDSGFVLLSMVRTGPGTTACSATPGPGVTTAGAAGGTSYANPTGAASFVVVTCTPLNLANEETRTMTVVIRPNVNPGNTGRTFTDTADFFLDLDGNGTADSPSGTDASGSYNFNTDTSAADDSKSATLPFSMGSVDLITNKVDQGFAGAVDPLGYDGTNPAGNLITYQVTVRNSGPSAATNVRIADTLTPAAGRTVLFVGDSATAAGVYTPNRCTVLSPNPAVGAPLGLDCSMPGVGFNPNVEGSVASGSTSTLFLRYQYQTAPGASGDTLLNVAVASSAEADTDPSNNTAPQTTTIRARADVAVTKQMVATAPAADPTVALPAAITTVTLRQPFFYVLEGVNNGPGASLSRDRTGTSPLNGTGTRIVDTLPAGVVVTGPITWQKVGPVPGADEVPNGTGSCTQATLTVTCNLGDMTVTGRVRIIVPARWDTFPANGTSNNTATISTEQVDPTPGNNTVTVPLATTRSSIAGVVYEDRDRAGANGGTRQAGTEPGITGITITLSGTDAYGNAVNRTTTTAADGTYSFGDLSPSNPAGYAIVETQPAGIQNGPVDPPANGPVAASLGGTYAAGTPNSTYTAIPVGASDTGVRYDFPEVGRPSLSGFVYVDADNNNTRTAGEPPIVGATVELLNATTGAVVATTVTLADGSYSFTNLDPLIPYALREPLPTGFVDRPNAVNPGTIGGAACATCTVATGQAGDAATTNRISAIDLSSGQGGINFNFGEVRTVSIAGTVYLDLNNNGAKDSAAETGLAGVTFELTGTDEAGNPVTATTTSDAAGNWSFTGLLPGTYTVTEPTQPTGTGNGITRPGTVNGTPSGTATPVTTVPSVVANVNLLVPGSSSVNNLFGELPLNSSISGRVFLDTDNDGLVDASETGIGTVTVTLTGTDTLGNPVTRTTTTAADGSYSFTDLPPGTYTVTEPTQPPGTLNGQTRAGTGGGTATPPATAPSVIAGITLGVGQSAVDNNFGELPAASIAGRVYSDNDNDGVVDPGETGIANVSVVLTGTDDLGNPVNVTVATDGNGAYSFPGLRPGTYTVTEPTQPPTTLNGITTPGTVGGTPRGTATPVATTPSAISTVTLVAGDTSVENNFGEIGDSPDLVVSKAATPATFTVNNVGTYTISVRNVGQQPTAGVYTVEDRLPAGLTLAATPVGTGWTCTGATGADRFSCTSSSVVAIGATAPDTIVARVNVAAAAATGAPIDNAVIVQGGGENTTRQPSPAERAAFEGNPAGLPVCDPAITQNACRRPTPVQLAASVSGTVWFDEGSTDGQLDGGDRRLAGWLVEVVDAAGTVVGTATTGPDGRYAITNQVPGVPLSVRFRDPAAGILWGSPVNGESGAPAAPCNAAGTPPAGSASSCVSTDGGTSHLAVVLVAGQDLPQQSLPLTPGGVVYDSTTRNPVPGSVVTLTPVGTCAGYSPAASLLNVAAGGYRINGDAVAMTVGPDGFYQFLVAPTAPASCRFQIAVTPPAGYTFVSGAIVPEANPLNPPGTPGVAYDVQPNADAPTGAPGTGTTYYLQLNLGSAVALVVHNHLPLDPQVAPGLVILKTGDRKTVEVGDTLLYSISIRQTAGSALGTVNIVDRLPPGFTFIAGTARVDGSGIANPLGQPGPTLVFDVGALSVGGQKTLTYRVRVGVGSQQGDGTNRARGFGCSITGGCVDPATLVPYTGGGVVASNATEFRVRVSGGVFADEGCVLGKVFVDCNANSVQDREEIGIPGVRLYFEDGTWMVSDSEGKYSYCGLPPKSHTLKVDGSTLPKGARMTTSSNRNLGDADSLFIDLKNGELHRADFIEGSCSNPVIEQAKARRTQGEVRAPETEPGQPALQFQSKPRRASQQPTDSSDQAPIIAPRATPADGGRTATPAAGNPEVTP